MRDAIYAIVEGHGEAGNPALGIASAAGIVVARLLAHRQEWQLHAARGAFRLRSCGDFTRPGKLENALRYYASFDDCAAVLILFDLDDGCAAEIASDISKRVLALGALPYSVAVVCATREFEAWFLASLPSIQGEPGPDDPEAVRDAKGWLRRRYGYQQVHDQAAYCRKLDLDLALGSSRSFRRMAHALEQIAQAHRLGQVIVSPPAP
jgi:hypothetical protein